MKTKITTALPLALVFSLPIGTVCAETNAGNPDLSINYNRLVVDLDGLGKVNPELVSIHFGGFVAEKVSVQLAIGVSGGSDTIKGVEIDVSSFQGIDFLYHTAPQGNLSAFAGIGYARTNFEIANDTKFLQEGATATIGIAGKAPVGKVTFAYKYYDNSDDTTKVHGLSIGYGTQF